MPCLQGGGYTRSCVDACHKSEACGHIWVRENDGTVEAFRYSMSSFVEGKNGIRGGEEVHVHGQVKIDQP